MKSIRTLAVLSKCLLLAIMVLPVCAQAKSLYGKVRSVQSGEQFTFDYGNGVYEVHLFGIAAPAASDPLAAESARFIRDTAMGPGHETRIWVMDRDASGLIHAKLLVDGNDVGLALVRDGLAAREPDAHYKPTSNDQPDVLVAAENEARLAGRGLWRSQDGQSPRQPAADSSGSAANAAATPSGGGTVDRDTSQRSGGENECAVAQNPANPLQLFNACNVASGAGMFAARSIDGGATWIYPDPSDKTITDGDPGQGASACCDPTLAWDSFGNLYITYINAGTNAIVTILSTDGGEIFSDLATFSGSVDQPTVVANDTPDGVAVWVVWNQSGSMVARGAIATALGTVGAFGSLQSIPSSSGCSFGDIAIAPSGAVVQVCEVPTGGQGPANIRLNVDADGVGANPFGSSSIATATNVGGFDFIPAQNSRSVDAEAGVAFNRATGTPGFGRLFLVYTEETVNESNDMDILVRYSDDVGATWSTPIRVNDDATSNSQFLPKIASDPVTGNVAVCWHDARNAPSNNQMELFCSTAVPTAGVPVFAANVQVSDGISTSNGSGVEYGDYMGLTFHSGIVTPVWADTSNSTGDNPDATSDFDAYIDQLLPIVLPDIIFANGFDASRPGLWVPCFEGCE
jgi:endonuclease YncB( thermonuclease family)